MLTFLHPLVDFCSVAVLVSGGLTADRWLVYNAIAFALQCPLGFAIDALSPFARKVAFGSGCAFVAAGAALLQGGGWLPLALACTGNALFHLTAGAWVLDAQPGKSGPVGLFISTGALGLMAGHLAATHGHAAWTYPVAVALVAGAVWQMARGFVPTSERVRTLPRLAPLALTGLVLLVVGRGWAGLFAGTPTTQAGIGFALAGAAATWAGKAAGGYCADWLALRRAPAPRLAVTLASIAGSAALCGLCGTFATGGFCAAPHAAVWLALLFVANLATGPVLSLMDEAGGGHAGLAFGLNSAGLFAGSLLI